MNKKVVSIFTATVLSAALMAGCQGSTPDGNNTDAQGESSETSSQAGASSGSLEASDDASNGSDSETGADTSSESDSKSEDDAKDSSEEISILEKYPSVAKDADTLVVAQATDPRGLDPAFADDAQSARIISQIYEGLLMFDDDSMDVQPCLAKSWEISDDKLTYTFHLEPNVKFQDGTDFNADAVKYNVDRQTVNKTESMAYANFVYGYVKECRVVDEETVEIELKSPCTPFLSNLAMPMAAPIVSPTACEANGNSMEKSPVGTGPYTFDSWTDDGRVVLERNESYWGDQAGTKNLVFQTIPELTERVEALTAGAVDITEALDPNVLDQIEDGECEVIRQDGMNISYMAYNTEKITDSAVRKALSQAIDVEELTETLYGEDAEAADSILPDFIPGYSEKIEQTEYDFEASSTAFAKSSTIPFVHIITYANAQSYNTATGQSLAETVQGYLDQVDVIASIDTYDWDEYRAKLDEGDYDICFYGWMGDNGDADNFLSLFADADPTMNVARYKNQEYNDLLAQAVGLDEGSERNSLYEKAEQMLADDNAVLPLSHQQILCGYNPKLSEVSVNPTGNINYSKIMKDV